MSRDTRWRDLLAPHRLGAACALVLAVAILASALIDELIPEVPIVGGGALILFLAGRYWLLPRIARERYAVQLLDGLRSWTVAIACVVLALAVGLAVRRRLPSFPSSPSAQELLWCAVPLGLLALPLAALALGHRWNVRHALWGTGTRRLDAAIGAFRLITPALGLLYLPALFLVSDGSARWRARRLFDGAVAETESFDPREFSDDMAAPLAELLWASEAQSEGEKAALQKRARLLLSQPRAQVMRPAVETLLGVRPARALAVMGPGEEVDASQRFLAIAAAAHRPFVPLWLGRKDCDATPPQNRTQEWLWLLANVCEPTDTAAALAWRRRTTRGWLEPTETWSFQDHTWIPRELPLPPASLTADRQRLLHVEMGTADDFDQTVLGRQNGPPCLASQPWRVVHVWQPATANGPAIWEGGLALSRRRKGCWSPTTANLVSFKDADCRQQARLTVAIVLIARHQAPAKGQSSDPELVTQIFGARQGDRCQSPAPVVTNRPIFALEAGGGFDEH